MILKVFGSGSSGNCMALINDNEILLLDAGIPYKEILRGIDYRIGDVVGVLITHEHKDHSKHAEDFLKAGIDVYRPYEDGKPNGRHFGEFYVKPFECKHNVPCYGFFVKHKEIGRLIYATDTCYIKYKFENLNHIIVECNWSKDHVDITAAKYLHELEDHMEKDTCLEFIKANATDSLKTVILAHLSQEAIDGNEVVEQLEKELSKAVFKGIAKRDFIVNL